VSAAEALVGIVESELVVSTGELLSAQPATRIPAMRIVDASSTTRLLFCIGFISWIDRSCTARARKGVLF
jgi:hypothetical protein